MRVEAGISSWTNWALLENSPVRLQGQFRGADVAKIISRYPAITLPISRGMAYRSIDIAGRMNEPEGSARIHSTTRKSTAPE